MEKGNIISIISQSYMLIAVLLIALLVSGISLHAQTASRKNTKVIHPEWSKNAVIYEVNIRQYTPEGTFRAFMDHMPRLKEMGIDILWLMPVHPIGKKERKGSLGSYYSVKDYKGINPEFGTMDDFEALVQKAHELGMYVIIDWVANHTAWDNPLLAEHPEWYKKDSEGNFESPYDWSDVVQLDYEKPALQKWMIGALAFWVEETNIDGFRCDVAGMVPTSFWEKARKELDKHKPVFMLAEAEKSELLNKAFDMDYSWELHHIMNEIARGKKNADDLIAYQKKADTVFPRGAYRMLFTSNHDENSWNGTVYERMGDAAAAFAALSFVLPGMPLIYSGQESGMDKRLRFFEKDTILWEENHPMEKLYTRLIAMKKDNASFWNGKYGGRARLMSENGGSVLKVYRYKDNTLSYAVFNLSDKEQSTRLVPQKRNMQLSDIFSGQKLPDTETGEVTLKPWEYRIFSAKNHYKK